MKKYIEKIDCTDIYSEEIGSDIKALKKFREAWMNTQSSWNEELFQYADDEFYFYRFAVERQEDSSGNLLTNILYRVMERYNTPVEEPGNAPFNFIIQEGNSRIGYRFEDFFVDEDVNTILDEHKIEQAVIIRTWKKGRPDEWISSENKQYRKKGIKLRAVSISEFYQTQFGEDECKAFLEAIEKYLQEVRNITGYQSIKFLSSMNLASRKIFEEKMLAEWDYNGYKYKIIDPDREEVERYLYILNKDRILDDFNDIKKNYVDNNRLRTMVGTNEYAESFITSEWLYYSLKDRKNFDYTCVISGYLKSIEQLLYKIVMLNIDNNCKISMKKDMLQDAYKDGVKVYRFEKNKWMPLSRRPDGKGYVFTKFPYMDFTTAQEDYMDSSIGTFEHFIRKNPHILSNPNNSKAIADMVSCFRTECRNGFFHTHNLNDWDIVNITRNNAIYLYCILLGSCVIPKDKECGLDMPMFDSFDELCKKIREFRHYNVKFIFEYNDGKRQKLIYDSINNTAEYTDDGTEHYESLLFYKVDDFEGALEQLDKGIHEDQVFYLRRDNLPKKIFGVHRKIKNGELEEIEF